LVRFTPSEARNSSAEQKARASKPNSLSKILANRFAIESGELADRLHAEPLPVQLFDVTHFFPPLTDLGTPLFSESIPLELMPVVGNLTPALQGFYDRR
jgi:hypothetical protein